MHFRPFSLVVLFSSIAFAAGCSSAPATGVDDDTGSVSAAIVNGTKTTEYPESVVVNSGEGECGGVLIAPTIVLTTGYCALPAPGNQVIVRGGGGVQRGSRTIVSAFFLPAPHNLAPFNRGGTDVSVVFLEKPIEVAHYATLSPFDVPDGQLVSVLGRTHGNFVGELGNQISPPVPILGFADYPTIEEVDLNTPGNYYYTRNELGRADSGGPVFVAGTHQLVGVSSELITVGTGKAKVNYQTITRLSIFYNWIQSVIAANGP
jgi:hypothetical protein